MDNITHTLTAVALSQAGLNRKTRYATLALLVGSNLPDIDIVARLGGSAAYLNYHRGITHSILGVVTLGALLAATIYYLGRKASPPNKRSVPPLDGPWLLAICLISTAGHVLMDFTNAYGVRPFMPFSGRWYAWDIMFIFDPLLLANRQTFDRRIWIDGQFEFVRKFANLFGGLFQIERRHTPRLRTQHDVFNHSHWFNQHEVLMDHADAERDCIVRRANLAHLAVNQNLAAISGVETVSDAHRCRFSGAVFADDRMNRSRRDFEAHPVIGQHSAEPFGDVAKLNHGLWSLVFGLWS